MGNNKKRRAPEPEVRKFRKKTSILTYEGITYVDYKDVNLLRKFMSERAKIRQRKVTGNSQKQQREIAKAIRIAREMALLPFNVRQVTSKSKKRRDDDEGTLDQAERREERAAKKSSREERLVSPEAKQVSEIDTVDAEAAELIAADATDLVGAEAALSGEES